MGGGEHCQTKLLHPPPPDEIPAAGYGLDAYAGAGARWFDREFRQYASRVPSPCGLTAVYKISQQLNKYVLFKILIFPLPVYNYLF